MVFPGGVVDPGDASLAAAWFGESGEAARACAVRELAEEAGLVLTSAGLRPLADGEAIESAVGAAPPGLADLREMARWLAPEILPKRFDAWFFSVAAPAGLGAKPDMIEVSEAWWERPADAMERHELWSSLMWPTYRTLEALVPCSTVEQVLALRVEQAAPPPELLATYRSPEWLR